MVCAVVVPTCISIPCRRLNRMAGLYICPCHPSNHDNLDLDTSTNRVSPTTKHFLDNYLFKENLVSQVFKKKRTTRDILFSQIYNFSKN